MDNKNTSRLLWIDWMKTIGMYFIILGHFFCIGHKYIYLFSVPLFFMVSGFLSKKEEKQIVFWNKLWRNLILPMVLIVAICFIIEMCLGSIGVLFGPFTYEGLSDTIFGSIVGSQSALAGCWFIYTLIVLKCILQYTLQFRRYMIIHLCIYIVFTLLAVTMEGTLFQSDERANAFINTFVAYPFFMLGYYAKYFKSELSSHIPLGKGLLLSLCLLILLYYIGNLNGFVWMYKCCYGEDFMLFVLGGVVGTIIVYLASKILEGFKWQAVIDISNGCVVILGFHYYFNMLVSHFVDNNSLMVYIISFFILVAFVPIIRLIRRFFPLMLGVRR